MYVKYGVEFSWVLCEFFEFCIYVKHGVEFSPPIFSLVLLLRYIHPYVFC